MSNFNCLYCILLLFFVFCIVECKYSSFDAILMRKGLEPRGTPIPRPKDPLMQKLVEHGIIKTKEENQKQKLEEEIRSKNERANELRSIRKQIESISEDFETFLSRFKLEKYYQEFIDEELDSFEVLSEIVDGYEEYLTFVKTIGGRINLKKMFAFIKELDEYQIK
eukprot:TRINITY_DN106845_c0_g1_i1.p1 TRINITY_DN106845_c0_g1~~TRINITY_DN106845_c0_g1_i1.p1  ORF type:complete len:166 (-),score=16.06 TRINITY_DN106845_c0_g1_i1:139-636(-)